MPGAKAIKAQLGFIKSMQKLIESLKDIDAAHFQQLQKAKEEKFEHFEDVLKDFLKIVGAVSQKVGYENSMLKPSTVSCTCVIVLSSDASFMGKLNTEVCRTSLALIEEFDECELVVLGKKGHVRLRYADARVVAFPAIVEAHRYEQCMELKNYVMKQRADMKIGDLWLVAPKNMGFGKQEVKSMKLLPAIDFMAVKDEVTIDKWQEICIESNMEQIVNYLIDTWLMNKFYNYAYESKLAEYSARTMHLEGSLDYLKGQVKALSLSYGKARAGETDTGMRETFASLMGG